MPNWCQNNLKVVGTPDLITRAKEAFERGEFLNEFIPSPSPDDDASDWYTWRLDHWGTKWDIGGPHADCEVSEDGTVLTMNFDSAWSPPIAAYHTLYKSMVTDRGTFDSVHALWYEGGMAFCGEFEDGELLHDIQIEGGSEWVEENVPDNIDEMFNISGQMAEWESEETD